MEISVYILIGLAIGVFIGWLLGKLISRSTLQVEREAMSEKYNSLDKDFATYRATAVSQLQSTQDILDRIVHDAHRIELKGESMRRKRSVEPENSH